jgi:hypothetical protein
VESKCCGGRRDASTVLRVRKQKERVSGVRQGRGAGAHKLLSLQSQPAQTVKRCSSRTIGGNHAQLFPAVTKVNWTAMRL